VEGITFSKHDIIFLSDCRLKEKTNEIQKLFGLNRNASYKLYTNSDRESRGVAIAIKRNIIHEILDIYRSPDQNILLCKIKVKNCTLTIGTIYGPNENNPVFFQNLRRKISDWGLPYIIGGDFNTILDHSMGDGNMDREGGMRVPNPRNGEAILNWIQSGNAIDPFRALYPEQREFSYVPFRLIVNRDGIFGKSRLDFFLIDRDLIDVVSRVKYGDKISNDFDHKMVSLFIGKSKGGLRVRIFNDTLEHTLIKEIGISCIYDCLNNHCQVRNENLARNLGIVLRDVAEFYEIEEMFYRGGQDNNLWERLVQIKEQIQMDISGLPTMDEMMELNFTCNWRSLYEALSGNLKNSLLELQSRIKKLKGLKRDMLCRRRNRMEVLFGADSDQMMDAVLALNNFDNVQLRERAEKYREFVLSNNEKPSKAFCLLGKENNVAGDIDQIKDNNGMNFDNNIDRKEHIRAFYSNLYKKKLDNLMRIESFLGEGIANSEEVRNKKLSVDESTLLEGDLTMEELSKALNKSNMSSSAGWDGISYKVIKVFFNWIGPVMVKMAKESFESELLTSTFRLGQITLIPKKGEATKVEDWRPITLLSCGYKIISGAIADRMEGSLGKVIGRAQKGFLRKKSMGTCVVNIMDRIAGSWNANEPLGILCVDFNKAFDSVEHVFINRVLEFFKYGPRFIGMVMTLLKNRTSRITVNNGYTDSFNIERGTPQGDRISPFIFILCIEILLIKIKSMGGGGVLKNLNFMDTWTRENGMVSEGITEGFADDLTLLFLMSREAVIEIKGILNSFYLVSGLSLNVGKTQLMIAGTDDYVVGTKVEDIEIVSSVKVLVGRKLG